MVICIDSEKCTVSRILFYGVWEYGYNEGDAKSFESALSKLAVNRSDKEFFVHEFKAGVFTK